MTDNLVAAARRALKALTLLAALLVCGTAPAVWEGCNFTLIDTTQVCTWSQGSGWHCHTTYHYGLSCQDPIWNPDPPPGEGGGGPLCPEIVLTNLQYIEKDTEQGFGRLRGSVSTYPPGSVVNVFASGPGTNGVSGGPGAFAFRFPIEAVPNGPSDYNVVAVAPEGCPALESSAMGVIHRTQLRALAFPDAKPYAIGNESGIPHLPPPPPGLGNQWPYVIATVPVTSTLYDVFDQYGSSPAGEIPSATLWYVRTTFSGGSVELGQTPYPFTLSGSELHHLFSASPLQSDDMERAPGYFYPPDSDMLQGFKLERTYYFDDRPIAGFATVEHVIVATPAGFEGAHPFGMASSAMADFGSAVPF